MAIPIARFLRNFAYFVLILSFGTNSVHGQSRKVNQQNFFGKWKLDESRSKAANPSHLKVNTWRLYQPDGNAVRVSWGNANGEVGAYSAKCDRSLESSSQSKIRCWQTGPYVVEGQQFDVNDRLHTYYRRSLFDNGKSMSITWYADAKRRHTLDQFVYRKQ